MGEFLTGRRVVAGALAMSIGFAATACGGKETSNEAKPVATSVTSSHEATPTPTPSESSLVDTHGCKVLQPGEKIPAPQGLNEKWPVAIMTGVKLNSHKATLRPYLGKIGHQYGVALTSPDGSKVTKVIPFKNVQVWGHEATSRMLDYCQLPGDLGKYENYAQGVTIENRRVQIAGMEGTYPSFAEAKSDSPAVDKVPDLIGAKAMDVVNVPTTPKKLAELGDTQVINN